METEKNQTLTQLLEEDREQVCASLQEERDAARARQVLEKETDRLMFRSAQMSEDPVRVQEVQGMLQVVRNTLPLLETVTQTEIWEKQQKQEKDRKVRMTLPAAASLLAGVICIVAGLIGQSIAGHVLRPMAVLWTAAGCALLVLGGYLTGRGGRKKPGRESAGASEGAVSQTFLIDPAALWHVMQGIVMTADHSLEETGELAKLTEMGGSGSSPGPMSREEIDFFSELLENAYARRRQDPDDPVLSEQVESIRYYLHARGVETLDYTAQNAKLFELLPSPGTSATLRPAMLCGGVLIRRGLAAGG